MYRSLLLVVLLVLFPPDQSPAQTGPSKTQPATNQTDAKAVPSSETNPEAKSLYDDGIERLNMGQISESVERFQKALEIDPEYVQAYSALGRAFFKLRQWDNASQTLRRAMALKAKEPRRQDTLQKNEIRGTEPAVAPSNPASKPKGANSNSADTKTPGLVSVRIAQPEEQRQPASVGAKQQPNLNKPLPTLSVDRAVAVATLDSALEPPEVSRVEAGAQANTQIGDLLSIPPPEMRGNAEAAPPSAPGASDVPQSDAQIAVNITPESLANEPKSVSAALPSSLADDSRLTTTYRVASKDVLEIRLSNSQPQQTTVFTVTESGLIEHPHLSEPLLVTGLTIEEIGTRIADDLKNRASIEDPKVVVGVLEYASHSLVVNGLVKNPGTKLLKSEAVPLAVVLAEAQPLPEAARATVVRNGNQILESDLNHTADMRLLVHPGDVVTLHPQLIEFFYIGGKVRSPGEKSYRLGVTLMQAIITAGGATSNSGVAEIVRGGDEGVRFDLKSIEAGKAADPLIKPRDRIILH